MNKLLRLQNIVSSILITTVACGTVVASSYAFAESADDDMSKLYLEATEASSSKDYATAVEKFKAYLELDPENQEVQAELAEAEKALGDLKAKATSGGSVPTKTSKSSFNDIIKQYEAVYSEAEIAIAEADELVARGQAKRALRLLSEVDSALPETSRSSVFRDKIAISRQRANIALRGETNGTAVAERMTEQQTRIIRDRVAQTRKALDRARAERSKHLLPEAIKSLDEAKTSLPNITSTRELSSDIDVERALVYAEYFYDMVDRRSPVEAESYLKMVEDLLGKDHKIYRQLVAFFREWRPTAAAQNPATINPGFIKAEAEATELLAKAHAQFLYGDYQGAIDSYKKVLLYLPDNAEAKSMQIRIHNILSNSGQFNREVMRASLLSDLDEKWNTARMFVPVGNAPTKDVKEDPIELKMRSINIPVSLRDAPLQRAIETLSELSQSYDPVGTGVDIILVDPDNKEQPHVNLTMKAQPLNKVLDTMLRTVGYTYEIKGDVVQVIPNIGATGLDTQEFTVSPKVVGRMGGGAKRGGGASPFGSAGEEATEENSEETNIRNFFQRAAGCNWEGDRSLAYDATSNLLIVTQDAKSLERIGNLLRSLSVAETKQVNIEAKFIEVNNNTLNQVVTNWSMTEGTGEDMYTRATTGNRTVAGAHSTASVASDTVIYTPASAAYTDENGNAIEATAAQEYTVPQRPPQVTRQPNYGANNAPTFTGVIGTVGDYDLRLILNAISASDGSDLMAAPSLTVISELEATIKIVQLLRWPQSYDDMQIQVSSSSNNNNNNNNSYGASSVGITPGTPQFDEEATEVGIQMRVLPRVNKEEKSITLELAPEIKEFEGFVEYGGTAVAISSGTIVTTPAGFFQPVFNLRQVATTVEVYDGGTIVIGGLTREEVRTVNDKVPILGDLPLIGAAFRSTGKSISKKNLLIFVTANLMARGGGTESGRFRGVSNGATYSNPSLYTSAGPIYREFDSPAPETGNTEQVDPTTVLR